MILSAAGRAPAADKAGDRESNDGGNSPPSAAFYGSMQAMPSPTTEPDSVADAALVARAARGEDDAWRALIGRYARRVAGLIRSRTGSAELAEEITQSVFVTVAEHLGSGRYVEQGRFESWLFRIAMNRLRDEKRRNRRKAGSLEGVTLAAPGEREKTDEGSLKALRSAIGRLPEADREIIAMRHHAQLEFRTIAELLNEPLGTVLARHHRALKKLRSLLSPPDKGGQS